MTNPFSQSINVNVSHEDDNYFAATEEETGIFGEGYTPQEAFDQMIRLLEDYRYELLQAAKLREERQQTLDHLSRFL